MIRTNERERERIRERLSAIRTRLLYGDILFSREAEELIRESNILNVRLKMMGG